MTLEERITEIERRLDRMEPHVIPLGPGYDGCRIAAHDREEMQKILEEIGRQLPREK